MRNDAWSVTVRADRIPLEGELVIPGGARGLVLLAHGSGSSRHSPRNRSVVASLHAGGLATLIIDLLTPEEELVDRVTSELRFDIGFLSARLLEVVDWLAQDERTKDLRIGLFGANTGAAAALTAAARRPARVHALVARGGRVDLSEAALEDVSAPTLLIVGGRDVRALGMNQEALARLPGDKRLEIVPLATHLFQEPGALEHVARIARAWFECYLAPSEARLPRGEPVLPAS